MNRKLLLRAAFTLIELLVVIAIIALLVGIASPVLSIAMMQGKMVAALNKAKQVGVVLHVYANDHGGTFPNDKNDYGESISSSNDAFRGLIPSYLDAESVFAVPGSKAGPLADDVIDSPSQILERGENHWAYVAGLSSTSRSIWPLVVDHTDGSGYYTTKDSEIGGTWKGRKAVVIHVDGSAVLEPLLGQGDHRFIPRNGDKTANALSTDYMGNEVKLLEPAH